MPEVELAALAAMQAAHEGARVVDSDAIDAISGRLEAEERGAVGAPAVHLAAFYWLTGSLERARGVLERSLRAQPGHAPARALLAWVILTQYEGDEDALHDESELAEAAGHAAAAADAAPDSPDPPMAKAAILLSLIHI